MARARMIVLYDRSAATNALVVGTGNKTEILLGYSTLYGDSASALNPLGDLYKTQLRQLARRRWTCRSRSWTRRPRPTCGWARPTKPSWALPMPRWTSSCTCWSISATARPKRGAGFEQAFVDRVLLRVRQNQFKRMLPVIAKLSNRTIGYDFLYGRDWGT